MRRKEKFIFSRWNSASSTDELPCSSVDCEFWQSQNIASVITTAIRGGTELSSLLCKRRLLMYALFAH